MVSLRRRPEEASILGFSGATVVRRLVLYAARGVCSAGRGMFRDHVVNKIDPVVEAHCEVS